MVAASTLFLTGCASGPHKANPPPPPSGFFYYRQAANPDKLVRIDWDGKPAGGLALRGRFTASPDGSRLLLPDGQILTAEGRMLPAAPPNSVWADDSRHLCAILDGDGNPANRLLPGQAVNGQLPLNRAYPPAFLYVLVPGGSPRKVAAAPSFGRLHPEVAACSIRFDTGVITNIGGPSSSMVAQVTRLSDGTQLLGQPGLSDVRAVSSDGQLVARADRAGFSTEIRRLPAGELLARLPYAEVVGFSADGTRLVAIDVPDCNLNGGVGPCISVAGHPHSNPLAARVIEWRTGRAIWSADGYPGSFAARPGASDVAVHVCLDPRCSSNDVWLVGDRSTPRRIASRVAPEH